MLYAIVGGERVVASPGTVGECECCHAQVRAKCGTWVSWHWAHIASEDCDPWAERMTDWHLKWQEVAPAKFREVVIGKHRADMITPNGWVIELQHSYLAPAEIAEREVFYGRMAWIWDVRRAYQDERLILRDKGTHVTFRWKHARKTIASCTSPTYLDYGGRTLILLKVMHPAAPVGGWGVRVPVEKVTGAWSRVR